MELSPFFFLDSNSFSKDLVFFHMVPIWRKTSVFSRHCPQSFDHSLNTTVNPSVSVFTSMMLLPVYVQRALATIKDVRKKQ